MIVRVCDTCRAVLDADSKLSVVAIADASGEKMAFRRVTDMTGLGRVSAHLCSPDCAFAFFTKWLSGELPHLPEVSPEELGLSPHKVPAVAGAIATVPGLERRQPTPAEIADSNGALMSVLGSNHG